MQLKFYLFFSSFLRNIKDHEKINKRHVRGSTLEKISNLNVQIYPSTTYNEKKKNTLLDISSIIHSKSYKTVDQTLCIILTMNPKMVLIQKNYYRYTYRYIYKIQSHLASLKIWPPAQKKGFCVFVGIRFHPQGIDPTRRCWASKRVSYPHIIYICNKINYK